MAASNPADPKKLNASTRMAYGAVMAPTSSPAMPGPPICAAFLETSSSELPSTSWSLRTSEGRYDWYDDVEEDRADADEKADDVELPDRQRVEEVRDRDGGEEQPRGRGP